MNILFAIGLGIAKFVGSITKVPAEFPRDADLIEKVNRKPKCFLPIAAWGALRHRERTEIM